MGRKVQLGLASLLGLLVVSMLCAIVVVIGLRDGETGLSDRDVPYLGAVATAALNAKGVANDQRGFLLTGDPTFVDEANQRTEDARAAFAVAATVASDRSRRNAVEQARTGFEQWVAVVNREFATYRAGDHGGSVAASLGTDRELRKSYEQDLAAAQALARSSIQSAEDSAEAASSRSLWTLVATLVLALLVGSAVAYWLLKTIANPLIRLVALLIPESPSSTPAFGEE
jgi:methyl-accepting chemotaxis protein